MAGDRRVEAGNLYALVQAAFWGPTPVAEAIRRCQEIRGRAEGSYRVEMAALHTLAGLHAMAGQFGQARELGEAAAQIAEKLGPSRFAAICPSSSAGRAAGRRPGGGRALASLGRWHP